MDFFIKAIESFSNGKRFELSYGCSIANYPKCVDKADFALPTKAQIEAKIKELEAKAKLDEKYKGVTNYIYKHYPQTKQNSDLADKLYYENVLKAGGFENLEQVIVGKVVEFENGKSFDELLSDVDEANKEAIAQLLKVGIRVTWVQRCKEELKKALTEDREPSYPAYPLLEG